VQSQIVPGSAAKRSRREDASSSSAIVPLEAQADQATALIKADQAPTRTSKLHAPIMLLEGHNGACYTTQVGQALAELGPLPFTSRLLTPSCTVCKQRAISGFSWKG